MPQWEYLEVHVDYDAKTWSDSSGRTGLLVRSESRLIHSGGLLNDLGQQRWELVGMETHPYISSGNSNSTRSDAKWIFKRPL